jgi:methyl coenzyme M reductase gamma subunit
MNQQNPNSGDLLTTFPRVTTQMVRSRTVELASIAGRSSIEIRQRDYEQAKRELTGETDFDRQHAVLHPGY